MYKTVRNEKNIIVKMKPVMMLLFLKKSINIKIIPGCRKKRHQDIIINILYPGQCSRLNEGSWRVFNAILWHVQSISVICTPKSYVICVTQRIINRNKICPFFLYILLSNSSFSLIIQFIFFKPEFHAISFFFYIYLQFLCNFYILL